MFYPSRDQIVSDAKSVQDLASRAAAADPALWKALTGNGFSKTPLGTVVVTVITWVSGYYGFGWSPEFCTAVASLLGVVGGYVVHYFATPDLTKDADKAPPPNA